MISFSFNSEDLGSGRLFALINYDTNKEVGQVGQYLNKRLRGWMRSLHSIVLQNGLQVLLTGSSAYVDYSPHCHHIYQKAKS